MYRIAIAAVVVSAALLAPSATSHAALDCKHRGYAHIDHHGGKLEDDRYHLMHHEKVSCDGDKHEGKADEDAEEGVHDAEHDAKHAEPHEEKHHSDEPHLHHHDKIGPHEHHHRF